MRLYYPNINDTSPVLYRTIIIASFMLNTCSVVMALIVLVLTKKATGSIVRSKKDMIFLLFTIITIILWGSHFYGFAGFIEERGYEISSNPIWQIYAPLWLLGYFISPFLCIAILVLAVLSLIDSLRHRKIENKVIYRTIVVVLVGILIMIGLQIIIATFF